MAAQARLRGEREDPANNPRFRLINLKARTDDYFTAAAAIPFRAFSTWTSR